MNIYSTLIERIFQLKYSSGAKEIGFLREELVAAADELNIALPKNLGDIVYSFRYRNDLPTTIAKTAPEGEEWIIRPAGKGRYRFCLTKMARIIPRNDLAVTKVPNATPGIIEMYSVTDEQALLAKIRYNRLLDIFTGVTCYSLQNHLRTTVENIGQVETDEIYVGVDSHGVQYVFPMQAKGGSDQLGIVQIEQDFALCAQKYPTLVCIPVAAQFLDDSLIVLFAFEISENQVRVSKEMHYRLVSPDEVTPEDLRDYQKRR